MRPRVSCGSSSTVPLSPALAPPGGQPVPGPLAEEVAEVVISRRGLGRGRPLALQVGRSRLVREPSPALASDVHGGIYGFESATPRCRKPGGVGPGIV